MSRTRVNAWLAYALTGLVATALIAAAAGAFVPAGQAVWFAAGVAYAIQLVAFAVLLVLRGQAPLFMVAWLGGMVLRFAVLGLVAFWLSRSPVLPRATTLVSYVAFVFLLLLLEPLFLRWDLRES